MFIMRYFLLLSAIVLGMLGIPYDLFAMQPLAFTSDELGRLVVTNEKEFNNLKGKTLVITGEIESLNEPYIFLKTEHSYKTGQPVRICIRMLDFRASKAKVGELITLGGELEVDGVFGPSLKNGRLPLPQKK